VAIFVGLHSRMCVCYYRIWWTLLARRLEHDLGPALVKIRSSLMTAKTPFRCTVLKKIMLSISLRHVVMLKYCPAMEFRILDGDGVSGPPTYITCPTKKS